MRPAALSPQPNADTFDPDAIGLAYGETPPADAPPLAIHYTATLPTLTLTPRPLEEMRGDRLTAMSSGELPSLPLLGQRGLVIEGWSHLVAGYPRSGKTDLLTRQMPAWMSLGHRVLYISEESSAVWTARLSAIPADWSGVVFVFGLGADPPRLAERAWSGSEDVVILDAIRNLLRLTDENDNSEIARRLNPWIDGARQHSKTFIAAHHSRKGSGEHGEGIAGGHALLGLFDVGLEIARDRNSPRRRLIRPYARVVSPPELLYEKGEDDELRALGDPAEVAIEEVRERIKACLTHEWQGTVQVHESLSEPQPSREQVRKALVVLARSGKIERDPPLTDGEKPGKTYKWRLVRLPTQPPTSPPTEETHVVGEVQTRPQPHLHGVVPKGGGQEVVLR